MLHIRTYWTQQILNWTHSQIAREKLCKFFHFSDTRENYMLQIMSEWTNSDINYRLQGGICSAIKGSYYLPILKECDYTPSDDPVLPRGRNQVFHQTPSLTRQTNRSMKFRLIKSPIKIDPTQIHQTHSFKKTH